jgi:hypothetical protein
MRSMAYRPGSFSKNFAWHGRGLSKLHNAIRAGFSAQLTSTSRDNFRANCGTSDADLQLIPVNFFLFNTGSQQTSVLAVDELVFQAVEQPHSALFDRLALFALHLSEVGNIRSGGTPWARDFVLQRLWADGFWRRPELEIARLDDFLGSALDARPEVRIKCRSNYRHLFALTGYLDVNEELIDNRDGPWLSSALLLAWDRAILSAQIPESATTTQLVEFIRGRQVARLLGVPESFAEQLASRLAPSYAEYRAIRRFDQDVVPGPAPIPPVRPAVRRTRTRARQLDEVARDINVSEVSRVRREVEQQLRNSTLAATLKELYGSQCMFCESRICVSISPEQFYVEAVHIRPLGRPHNGPDHARNMLVLCPNCHVQFDAGTLGLILRSPSESQITSKTRNHPLDGKIVRTRGPHRLDGQFVEWHQRYWRSPP